MLGGKLSPISYSTDFRKRDIYEENDQFNMKDESSTRKVQSDLGLMSANVARMLATSPPASRAYY